MGDDPDADAFARELGALKRRGCNLLVVDPPGDGELCEELLGDPAEPRRRIVVDTGDGRHGHAGEDRVVVDGGDYFTRSAASTTQSADPTVPRTDLEDVREAIQGHVERFEREGLEPGELRLCLGEFAPLAVGEDPDEVVEFLNAVTELVRDASGMGHLHAAPDTATRDRIEDLFDVTVDLRTTSSGRQYRWRLHESGLDSGWIALD